MTEAIVNILRLPKRLTSQPESIIADSTAAYISEQAAHLGLTCRAEVRCEVRDGTPQPASAAMDIPYDARLAAAIADDLGIPAEKQSWQGGEAP